MRPPASTRSRRLVFIWILAAHAVLIYMMAMSRVAFRPERAGEFRSQPIYLMPLIEEPPPQEASPVRREAMPARVIRSQPVPAESTAITLTQPQQVPVAENTGSPIDWDVEAVKALQKMERTDSNMVLFGDLPEEEPVAKAPHGVFEKRNPREAGYTEELAPGITRRWISDVCYQEFGHLPPLFAGQGPAVNPVRCIQPGEPYGDLFDHLKPEYLKRKPQ